MAKNIPEFHLDILGKEIRKGSFVFSNWWNGDLQVCVVDGLSSKMVKIRKVTDVRSRPASKNKYPKDLALVENTEDLTMYIFKNSTQANIR